MTAEITVRACTTEEWPRFVEAGNTAFGSGMSDDNRRQWDRVVDPSRMLVATDPAAGRDAIVGTAGWVPFEMTVPGAEVPVAAVTMVAVLPSHRRRGILRQMMRRQFDDLHDQGLAVATLWASEAPIYQRFGYGLGFVKARIEVDTRRATFLGNPEPVGQARLIDEPEALDLLPDIYERATKGTPGRFRRSPLWWEARRLFDPPSGRGGGSALFRMVLEIEGRLEGYALYRVFPHWDQYAVPGGAVEVIEALGTSPTATREVWRYLFGIDLVTTLRTHRLCADHPLFLALTDQRQLRMHVNDGTWVRIVDVGPALEARRYGMEGRLTFELRDDFCSWNAGTWTLNAGPDGAEARRSTAAPELQLSAADLGAMYLGTVSCSSLVRAGRVRELRPGAASTASALFRSEAPPWCLDDF